MPYLLTVEVRCMESSQWRNVDVLPEEVFGVVLQLDLPQTREVWPVRHRGWIDRVVFEIVHVARRRQERREGCKRISRPGNAPRGVCCARPLRDDHDVEPRRAKGTRRARHGNAA